MIKSIDGVKIEVANSFTPTEQEWLWAVEGDYNYERLHYTFSVLWEVYDRFNVKYWVPDMDTLRVELPSEINIERLGSKWKDKFTLDGVEYTGYDNAIMAMIGWKHPNRTKIIDYNHVREEFNWDDLKLVGYVMRGNNTQLPTFKYKGRTYQSVKTLADTYNLKESEVKKKTGVVERDDELIKRYEIRSVVGGVRLMKPLHHTNYETILKTPTELRKAMDREANPVSYQMAKKIFAKVTKK